MRANLPEGFGWVEWRDGKAVTHKAAEIQKQKSATNEVGILLSVIKRIGQNAPEGCAITCYTYQTKNTTVAEIDLSQHE